LFNRERGCLRAVQPGCQEIASFNPSNRKNHRNAFAGGFAVGWVETGDLLTAGLYGSVASSFAIEQMSVPIITSELIQSARKRVSQIRPSAWAMTKL